MKEINIPSSKSYLNRLLILGSLNPKPYTIRYAGPLATDVKHLIQALEQVGLVIKASTSEIQVQNSFPACQRAGTTLYVGEGGTTLRFLVALLALGDKPYELHCHPGLLSRPSDELFVAARSLGFFFSKTKKGFLVKGPIKNKKVIIDCSRSTQFASAFELIANYAGLSVIANNIGASRPYLELTKHLTTLKETIVTAPADFSSASYFIAWALNNKSLKISNILSPDPFQADSIFLDILQAYPESFYFNDGLIINPQKITNLKIDCSDCLDLFPTLIYLALFNDGQHHFSGLNNLAFKESPRLKEVALILKDLGVPYQLGSDSLEFKGSQQLNKVTLSPPADHRLVMMSALIERKLGYTKAPNNQKAVAKSFPNFFKLLAKVCN